MLLVILFACGFLGAAVVYVFAFTAGHRKAMNMTLGAVEHCAPQELEDIRERVGDIGRAQSLLGLFDPRDPKGGT